LDQVREVITNVLDDVAQNGITAAELSKAKGQVSGGMVLGLEDTSSRMSRIARSEMNNGYVPSVSEVLDRVSAVTMDEVHALAHQIWSQDRLTAVVGPE
jgi:predicted Zn-dependent peptidase